MNGQVAGAALVQALLGVALIALGTWGTGAADSLAEGRGDAESRERARVTYHRGGRVCQVVGALLLLFALLVWFDGGPPGTGP